jgi:hypothetical protein
LRRAAGTRFKNRRPPCSAKPFSSSADSSRPRLSRRTGAGQHDLGSIAIAPLEARFDGDELGARAVQAGTQHAYGVHVLPIAAEREGSRCRAQFSREHRSASRARRAPERIERDVRSDADGQSAERRSAWIK